MYIQHESTSPHPVDEICFRRNDFALDVHASLARDIHDIFPVPFSISFRDYPTLVLPIRSLFSSAFCSARSFVKRLERTTALLPTLLRSKWNFSAANWRGKLTGPFSKVLVFVLVVISLSSSWELVFQTFGPRRRNTLTGVIDIGGENVEKRAVFPRGPRGRNVPAVGRW